MNNTNWSWEAHFNLDSSLLIKILLVLLLVLWGRAMLRRRRKKRENSDGSFVKAHARKRHEWRYVRWPFQMIQIAFALYLLWSLISIY